jgi:hypothetical protein
MRLGRSPFQAHAPCQLLVHGLACPQGGKRVPGGGAALRTERVLGLADLAQQPAELLLTAERAMRTTLRAGAGTVEHACTW